MREKLEREWSPAQIAANLGETYPDRLAWRLCHENIYQSLYHGGKGGPSSALTPKLRTGPPLGKRRRGPVARTPRFLAPGRLIDERPAVVEHRADRRLGGRPHSRPDEPLGDRHPGRPAHRLLASGASARRAQRRAVARRQGCHDLLATNFADGIFFTHPGSPWLRGTNKNTNGLLRQYFPKGSDLRVFSLADPRAVEERLDERPPKRLGRRSPAQTVAAGLAS